MPNLVKVKTYRSEVEAEIGAAVLREEGVEAFIHSDDAGGFQPQLQMNRGVNLMVADTDSERAIQLLDAAQNT